MVNNCESLDILLNICKMSGAKCLFMADPHSCAGYEDAPLRQYQSLPSWADKLEHLGDVEQEQITHLKSIMSDGVKDRRTEIVKEPPDWF